MAVAYVLGYWCCMDGYPGVFLSFLLLSDVGVDTRRPFPLVPAFLALSPSLRPSVPAIPLRRPCPIWVAVSLCRGLRLDGVLFGAMPPSPLLAVAADDDDDACPCYGKQSSTLRGVVSRSKRLQY